MDRREPTRRLSSRSISTFVSPARSGGTAWELRPVQARRITMMLLPGAPQSIPYWTDGECPWCRPTPPSEHTSAEVVELVGAEHLEALGRRSGRSRRSASHDGGRPVAAARAGAAAG